ncbi:MAG: hypothetical protein KAW90_00420 [Dehalococcoidales bacterium]|nr:hypothetical protein [Dehalococcoidales bacterium]
MNIIFTEMFSKECRDKFQIAEVQVQQAITSPNEQEAVKLDELELRFFVKQMPQAGDKYYLLVCTRWDGSNLLVDLAFRIPAELVDEAKTLKPIILLQQLALKFGLTIRVGQQLNKFIFGESIPIKPFDKPTELVEVINPEKHSFMQSMFIKIEQQGDEKIANCALAYCIDSDRYLSWLTGKKVVGDVIIDIAPQLKGHVTPRDLIEACVTIVFWIDLTQLAAKSGFLFKVVSPDYYLEVGFTNVSFYIKRNDRKLEMRIQPDIQDSYAMCSAVWQTAELGLMILDKSYGEAIDSGADGIIEIENRTKVLKTPPTLPPNSLITWARKEAIAPITSYDSSLDFYQEVVLALQEIPDKARTAIIYNAFWDIIYKGSFEIAPRKPKREPDIVAIIHGLLFDVATAKNFQITPQYTLGGGKLDFLISGYLKSGEITNVCVEFKHAHSYKLRDGLLKQLPAYMQAKGCDLGIYCVMFFKGKFFERPKKYDLQSIDFYLKNLAASVGLSNIRIIVFDLSYPKPISQL